MKTYTIPKGTKIWRATVSTDEPHGLIGRWSNIISNKNVIYTEDDLRKLFRISDHLHYYEFNLPDAALPWTIIAVALDKVSLNDV